MFALVKSDDSIKLFAPYSIWEDKNGTQYSPDTLLGLTLEQKQELGIYDVAYGSHQDSRFYTISENAPEFDAEEKIVKISYTSTPKELEDSGSGEVKSTGLKSQWIQNFKNNANSLLASTDWKLVRKIEREVSIPTATVSYRAAVVAEANRLEAAITAATTVEELITAVESAAFPSAE